MTTMSTARTDGLRSFLVQWRALRASPNVSRPERLLVFLRKAHPLLVGSTKPSEEPIWRGEGFAELTTRLKPLVADYRKGGGASDLWAIAGLGRNEVRTAAVLTWLLDPRGSHGAGDGYLQSLWTLLGGASSLGFPLTGARRALRETHPLGDEQNRVDIEVEGDNFLLLIEVKIDAPIGPNQLERYIALAEHKAARAGKPHWSVLYLSGASSPIALRTGLIDVRWRQVAEAIRMGARTQSDFPSKLALLYAGHIRNLHRR